MTSLLIAAAFIALGVALLIGSHTFRNRPTTCPGLYTIPDSVDRLVAIAIGETEPDAAIQATLEHIAGCTDCAERFRIIMILRGAPATGAVHFTPESLRAMTERVPSTLQ